MDRLGRWKEYLSCKKTKLSPQAEHIFVFGVLQSALEFIFTTQPAYLNIQSATMVVFFAMVDTECQQGQQMHKGEQEEVFLSIFSCHRKIKCKAGTCLKCQGDDPCGKMQDTGQEAPASCDFVFLRLRANSLRANLFFSVCVPAHCGRICFSPFFN